MMLENVTAPESCDKSPPSQQSRYKAFNARGWFASRVITGALAHVSGIALKNELDLYVREVGESEAPSDVALGVSDTLQFADW
jgi:hypothetical protein